MTSKPINERATFDAWTVSRGRVVGYQGWREDFEIWKARARLAAPEAPRQEPVAFIQIPKNIEKYGHGDYQDRLCFGKPGQFFVDGKSPMFDFVPLYTAPISPDHSGGAGEVVLPAYRVVNGGDSDADQNSDYGWNACLDKVKELNQ
jgi:hypothetical protein